MGVLRFNLGFRVLHGPKNDQSLCNTIMGVLSLEIRLKLLHNKNVNAIPSCIYKLFQSSNYEIGDCFNDEGVLHKIMFLNFNGISINV
jgi:hypothetical protein